jgi:RNA polymerase sigma-70 factor, ECF subfamily
MTSSKTMVTEGEPDSTHDLELVARCQNGDTQAFGELVTRYRNKVHAMIYNMVRNEQDAWDIAQESFLKAWKSIPRFRRQSAFYTWLYRIVMNVTIDWMRRRKIEGGTEFDDTVGHNIAPGSLTTPAGVDAPQRKMERDEIRARIDAAIAKLSPEHRQVITLREIDGMEYHEIAGVIGCELGTVMSRLFYARRKMQAMLKDVYENL